MEPSSAEDRRQKGNTLLTEAADPGTPALGGRQGSLTPRDKNGAIGR